MWHFHVTQTSEVTWWNEKTDPRITVSQKSSWNPSGASPGSVAVLEVRVDLLDIGTHHVVIYKD